MTETLRLVAIIVAVILFIVLLIVSFLTPARAQVANQSVKVVSFADLDLRKRQDLRKLDRRIATAIASVCGPTSNVDPAGKNEARKCRLATADQVVAARDRIITGRAKSLSTAAR